MSNVTLDVNIFLLWPFNWEISLGTLYVSFHLSSQSMGINNNTAHF